MDNKTLKIGKNTVKSTTATIEVAGIGTGVAVFAVIGPYVLDDTILYQSYMLKACNFLVNYADKLVKYGSIALGVMTILILVEYMKFCLQGKKNIN